MLKARPFPPTQNKILASSKVKSYQTVKNFQLPLILTFLHIPLGLLLYSSSALALLHPLIIICLGLYYAVRKNEKLHRVAYIVAYLVGSEVLWRMAKSPIPWEFGKYGAAVIMIVALVYRGYWKFPLLPWLYLVFLIPACLLTLMVNNLDDARSQLSSNMSGPFLLFISCWFFSHLRVNFSQLKTLLITTAVPIMSVAVITLFYTFTAEDISFSNDSNFATSGGFGPNQVSAMLGMGAFICFTCYLIFRNNLKDTIYLGVLIVLFAAQSVMTFSRGGMYNAMGGTIVVIFFQMRNLSQSVKKIFPIAGLLLFFLLLVFPYLNDFTGGKLQERFEDTGTTNRTEIIESEIKLFLENPFLGVGVGESKSLRKEIIGFQASSHTEFARLISEHGIFGILSLIALALGIIYNFRRQSSIIGKAFVGGVIMWSTLFMLNAGMRLAAVSFMWGLSYLTIVLPQIRRRRSLNLYLQNKHF